MTDTKQFSELPPLPDPAHRGPDGTGSYFDSYTAAQVREAQRAAIEADHATPAAQAESRLDDDGWSLVFEYREALRYYFSNQFIAGDKEESFKDVVNAEKDLLEFIDAITASPAVAQQAEPALSLTCAGIAMAAKCKALPLMVAIRDAGEGDVTLNQRLTTDQALQAIAAISAATQQPSPAPQVAGASEELTDERILMIANRAREKVFGSDAQALYIAREVQRALTQAKEQQ